MRRCEAVEMAEGSGARVRRLFPTALCESQDPFVLLDEFFVEAGAGFPEHPHRGFEAITYMLEGSFRHRDNLGNDSRVRAGGVQRFCAGSGIVHAEMPGDAPLNHGFQLWINLAAGDKSTPPDYQQVDPERLPVHRSANGDIRTIVGEGSPVGHRTDMVYQDIRLDSHTGYAVALPPGFRGFLYVYDGALTAGGERLRHQEAIVLSEEAHLDVTSAAPVRFIVVAGKPLGIPILIRGSFVE
jgi:redox-sensitive bicupin YhaK (pirin superfamily)